MNTNLKVIKFIKSKKIKLNQTKTRLIKDLENAGFEEWNSGCYKVVYQHPEFPDWLIKINTSGDKCDCNFNKLPKAMRKYYLRPIPLGKTIQIQRKVKITREAHRFINKIARKLNPERTIVDLHSANVGTLNGKHYFFDFYVW